MPLPNYLQHLGFARWRFGFGSFGAASQTIDRLVKRVALTGVRPASRASLNLLKVLLRNGLEAGIQYRCPTTTRRATDAVLLIGRPRRFIFNAPRLCMEFSISPAWYELTNLPFVLCRVGVAAWHRKNKALCAKLRENEGFRGLETLDYLHRNRENTTRISAVIYSAGCPLPPGRGREARHREIADCSRSTASGRCMTQIVS